MCQRQQRMGLWETCGAVSGQRQRECEEFPPDVCPLSVKIQISRVVSKCRLSFSATQINLTPSPFVFLADFQNYHQIFCLFWVLNVSLRPLVEPAQKGALQTGGEFCFPTGFGASFPDILFPHSDSSFAIWLSGYQCVPVCVCVCVYPVMQMLREQAGLC